MHELSLAEAVVDIASRHAGGRRVARVELRVGHLRQVVPSALAFAFELVADGTVARGRRAGDRGGARRGPVPGLRAESAFSGFPLVCARCGSWDVEVLRGEELLVDALELVEEALHDG